MKKAKNKKQKANQNEPIYLSKLVSGKGGFNIDLKKLKRPPALSSHHYQIEGFEGTLFPKSFYYRYLVEGFTPGAAYNLFWYNQDGFSVYAVTEAKISFLSRSCFNKKIRKGIKFPITSASFNLVGSTLWIGSSGSSAYRHSIRVEIDPETGKALSQTLVVKDQKEDQTQIALKFKAHMNRSRDPILGLKLDYHYEADWKYTNFILDLSKGRNRKIFNLLSPTRRELNTYKCLNKIFKEPCMVRYDQRNPGVYLFIIITQKCIFVTIFCLIKIKILGRRVYEIYPLIKDQLERSADPGSFMVVNNSQSDMAYSSSTKRLFFMVRSGGSVYLVGINDPISCSSENLITKKIVDCENSAGLGIKLIERGEKPGVLFTKRISTSESIGADKDDKVLVVDSTN